MEIELEVKKTYNIKTLIIHAGVRYWEDSDVNGEPDEVGSLIPCRVGDMWRPMIDIDSGVITNWKQGTKASIHYKVCDQCGWDLINENGEIILSAEDGYVPTTLCPSDRGYGDYIIMNIDENGAIENWRFDPDDFLG